MPSLLIFLSFLSFLALLVHNVSALGVQFTTPAAGATLPAGPFKVAWSDAGGDPGMEDLVSYTLELIVGGNTVAGSQVLQTIGTVNGSVSVGGLSGEIQANVSQSIQNGFYLQMTSNTTTGNTVINYSDRFTLIEMNGTTDSAIVQAANAAAGSASNVPNAQYNIIAQSPTTTSIPTATATATQTTTAALTSSSPPEPGLDHGDGSLSDAATAGIIVGAILAGIGAISLVVWTIFFYKHIARKKAERQAAGGMEQSRDGKSAFLDGKAELDGTTMSTPLSEMSPYQERFEAPGWSKAVEAPTGEEEVYELEGDIALWEASSGRRSKAWDPTA